MKLSLTQLSFSGTLLLLTMSNLLLWEHVASLPNSYISTGNLYQRMVELSHYTHVLASEVFSDISEDLLKVTIHILQAWEEPLKHMVAAVAALPDVSDVTLSRTKELEEKVLGLLEGLKITISRIQPRSVEDENTFWSGWSDLQSSDEATRNVALYTLARCVRRDTHKVDNYVKVLKCRDVHNNNC